MNESFELDLKGIALNIFYKLWLVVLCTIVAASAVYVYTDKCVTPLYKATITLYVNNNNTTIMKDTGYISASDLATSQRLVTTYIAILRSDTVLEKVAEMSGTRYTAAALRGMMAASAIDETEVFQVAISHKDPQTAADIANAVADAAVTEISNIVEGSSTKIVDRAKVPTVPYTPKKANNSIIGGALGALLLVIALTLQVVLDRHVKTADDIAKVSKAPVLGYIPDFTDANRSGYYNRRKYYGYGKYGYSKYGYGKYGYSDGGTEETAETEKKGAAKQ